MSTRPESTDPSPRPPDPARRGAQRIRRWCCSFALCGAALLLLWACYDQGAFLLPSKTIVALAAPGLGLIWAICRRIGLGKGHGHGSGTSAERLAWGSLEWLLLALGFLGALSAIWSLDPTASLRAAGILFGGLFLLRLGRQIGRSPAKTTRSALLLVGGVGTLVALFSIAGYAFRVSWLSLEQDGRLVATGTLGYANALAGFLLLTLSATAAVFAQMSDRPAQAADAGLKDGRGRSPRAGVPWGLVLACAAVAQLVALLLTWSRGAGAVLAVLLLAFFSLRAFAAAKLPGNHALRNRCLGVALVLVLVGGLVWGGLLLWGEFRPWGPMTADVFRINTWKAGLEAAGERPFLGHGLDTFFEAYAPFKHGALTAYAHNVVIQQLVELGAVGTALMVAFLALAAFGRVRLLAGPLTNPQIPLLLGVQAFALHNLVDLTWYFPALFLLFALLLGLMASYSAEPAHSSSASSSAS